MNKPYKPGDRIVYHDPVHGSLYGNLQEPELSSSPGWWVVRMDERPALARLSGFVVPDTLRLHEDWFKGVLE